MYELTVQSQSYPQPSLQCKTTQSLDCGRVEGDANTLSAGSHRMISSNNQFELFLQSDGNLVLSRSGNGTALWCSSPTGSNTSLSGSNIRLVLLCPDLLNQIQLQMYFNNTEIALEFGEVFFFGGGGGGG